MNKMKEIKIEKVTLNVGAGKDQKVLEKAVKLMTVHASKGLEFEYVFIMGLEENLFPHQPLDNRERTPEEEEEERRLFYVAITRAKQKLYLSYSETRTIYGSQQFNMPSRFFADIDNDLIEEENFEYREKIIYLEW